MGLFTFFKQPRVSLDGSVESILKIRSGSWFEADSVIESGGKVTALIDKLDYSHRLTQSNPTAQAVVTSSWANTNTSCLYFSKSYYVSTRPIDYWSSLHNGSGSWTMVVFQPTANLGAGVVGTLWSTVRRQSISAQTGSRGAYSLNAGAGALAYQVSNAGTLVNQGLVTSTVALNSASIISYQYIEDGSSTEWRMRTSTSSLGTGASTKAPTVNSASTNFTFGANGITFDEPLVGNVACIMNMKSIPTDSELQIISDYTFNKFGVRLKEASPTSVQGTFAGTTVVLWGIGESVMVGQGVIDEYMPAGYPPTDGTVKVFNDSFQLRNLTEPWDSPGTNSQVPALSDPNGLYGVGYMGMFGWQLQQQLGPNYQVMLVPCARNGSYSWFWTSGATLMEQAITKLEAAMNSTSNTVLGGIFLDQGINDAQFQAVEPSSSLGWNEKWDLNINYARTRLSISNDVPLFYRHLCETQPTNVSNVEAEYTIISGSQLLFQNTSSKPYKVMVESPDGPWAEAEKVHLDTQANVSMSNRLMAAWNMFPGVTS